MFSDLPYFILKDYFSQFTERLQHEKQESNVVNFWNKVVFSDFVDGKITDHFTEFLTEIPSGSITTGTSGYDFTDTTAYTFSFTYDTNESRMDNSVLLTPGHFFVTTGGNLVDLYIKDPEYGFRLAKVIPILEDPPERKYFRFYSSETKQLQPGSTITNEVYGREWSCTAEQTSDTFTCPASGFNSYFSRYNYDLEIITDLEGQAGYEVYFRKDSAFHDWLLKNAESYYQTNWGQELIVRNYVNTDKSFVYFGKIYPSARNENADSAEDTRQKYHIVYEGMKDYVQKAIPVHQRTTNFKEFLEIGFDKLYNESYQMEKDIFSMRDAMEVNFDFLGYISQLFNVDIDTNTMDETRQREFVRDIIHFLKRKGTYNAIIILWKLVSRGSPNLLNLVERWHSQDVTGKVSESDWVDFLYTDYYGGRQTNVDGAGQAFYDQYYSNTYPSNNPSDDGLIQSTNYRVEVDLTTRPLTIDEIKPETIAKTLVQNWEEVRPVNRVAYYDFLISPITDFTGRPVPMYVDSEYSSHLLTSMVKSTSVVEGAWIHVQNEASATWDIEHTLGTKDLLTQIFDENLQELVPDSISFPTLNTMQVVFAEPVKGILCAKLPDSIKTNNDETLETWRIRHALNTANVLIQFKDTEHDKVYPGKTEIIDINTIETEGMTGRAVVGRTDYNINIQSPGSKTWTINHNLGQKAVLIACYDNNNELMNPSSLEFIDQNTAQVTFDTEEYGFAVAERVGNPVFEDSIFRVGPDGNVIPPKVKVGETAGANLESGVIWEGTIADVTVTDDWYYMTVVVPTGKDMNVREIGLFDADTDEHLVYTISKEIYKPDNVELRMFYRFSRSPIELT